MKIAVVHELLTIKGGAEHVASLIAKQYPNADVYSLLAKPDVVEHYGLTKRLHKSSLQINIERIPVLGKLLPLSHHLWLPWLYKTAKKWDFSTYDVVISSSSGFAHHIQVPPHVKHICYVHSPARYLWDRTHEVQSRMSIFKRFYFKHIAFTLRQVDASVDHSNTTILAASKEVQRRIQLYWRQNSAVLYPPINNQWLQNTTYAAKPTNAYYLVVSTLVPYKRIHLAIKACNMLQLPLKIVGIGPDSSRLKAIAGPTVEFLDYVPNTNLAPLYYNAKAVLFVGDEDFGLVPLEAMSQGTPVIGFNKGGALETITPGITGEMFTEPTAESLAEVLQSFDPSIYNPKDCQATVQRFGSDEFLQKLDSLLSD